jgi:queuine/archaeosine tRNA-ribosyltransferase
MKQIRENIKKGTMEEFRNEFVKDYYGENKWELEK